MCTKLCSAAVALLALAASVVDAQPANDDWANRALIAALPFAPPALAVAAATTAASDPALWCKLGALDAGARSVWYAYTTGADAEYINLAAGGYDTVIGVFSGNPTAGFTQVGGGCNDNGAGAGGSRIDGLRLRGATEYSIVVAAANAGIAANMLQFSVSGSRVYVVNTTVDVNNGFCSAPCSLRDAISASNRDPGAVLIPAGTYTLTLGPAGENLNAGGDLDLTAGMGVYALDPGAVLIDGNNADRLLHLDPADSGAHTFTIADIELTNGNPGAADGGALFNDASFVTPVPTHDYVDLTRVVLRANRSGSHGGGARFNGTASILGSTVDSNLGAQSGGGLSFGAPPGQDLRWRVDRSTVSRNNSTGGGGGIYAVTATGQLLTSTVSANNAGGEGGGILVTAAGSASIADSTVHGNLAGGFGGGGGIRHEGIAVSISNSVLAANVIGGGPVTFTQDCASAPGAVFVGNHVTVETSCAFSSGSNNAFGVSAGLGPLTNNGGLTLTHKPSPGSVLIDSGPASCLPLDQRDKPRPQDGDGNGVALCDRGAFEIDAAVVDLVFRNGFEL